MHLECVLSLHDSVLKYIKNDHLYIFLSFHIVNITRRVLFFSSKISMITNAITILYNSSINNKLILRDLCFRHYIACFCSISTTEIIPNTVTALFCVSEQHDGDSFLNESTLNDSVQSQ